MKINNSYGIILLNYNYKKKKYEMLMIKKKHSYNFKDFVLGSYKKNIGRVFFNGMTLNEKEYIFSNNYEFMWYKIWAKFPNNKKFKFNKNLKKLYIHGNNIYNNNFPKNYNNINNVNNKLLNLLNQSINSHLIWEFPKGSKKNYESNIDAAIREFYEETNISYDNYRILWGIRPIIISFESNGSIYKYFYYLAILENTNIKILSNFKIYSSLYEISDIKWISLQDIGLINVHPKIKNKIKFFMKKAITLYKNYKKKNIYKI